MKNFGKVNYCPFVPAITDVFSYFKKLITIKNLNIQNKYIKFKTAMINSFGSANETLCNKDKLFRFFYKYYTIKLRLYSNNFNPTSNGINEYLNPTIFLCFRTFKKERHNKILTTVRHKINSFQ